MEDGIRNRPRIELAIRKNTSLTGAPLCAACGEELAPEAKFCGRCGHHVGQPVSGRDATVTPPKVIVTRERHNRGRGSFFDVLLRIVIIIALLAGAALVVLFIQDRYQEAEGRPATVAPTNTPMFSASCRSLAEDVLSPLASAATASDPARAGLRSRARVAAADPDTAELARLTLAFADRMDEAAQKRAELKQEEIRVLNRPAPTMSKDAQEQARVREFLYKDLGRRWGEYTAAQWDAVNRTLAGIEREEKHVAAPRAVIYSSAWDRLMQKLGLQDKPAPRRMPQNR